MIRVAVPKGTDRGPARVGAGIRRARAPPGAGGPGWGGPGWGGPGWTRRPGPPWFLLPLLPILFLFVVFGAIGGVVHGHFFAIIPLALLTFAILRIARFRHRWGGWRR